MSKITPLCYIYSPQWPSLTFSFHVLFNYWPESWTNNWSPFVLACCLSYEQSFIAIAAVAVVADVATVAVSPHLTAEHFYNGGNKCQQAHVFLKIHRKRFFSPVWKRSRQKWQRKIKNVFTNLLNRRLSFICDFDLRLMKHNLPWLAHTGSVFSWYSDETILFYSQKLIIKWQYHKTRIADYSFLLVANLQSDCCYHKITFNSSLGFLNASLGVLL